MKKEKKARSAIAGTIAACRGGTMGTKKEVHHRDKTPQRKHFFHLCWWLFSFFSIVPRRIAAIVPTRRGSILASFLFLFFASHSFADWAEETLAKMSREEKIGQLLIMPACQLRGEDHREDLRRAVQEYQVGGVILKQGSVEGQLELIAWLQELSKIPLLCVGDAEHGLSQRLSGTLSFPKNEHIDQIHDSELIYALGHEIGKECRRVGLHVNLAPVMDVNVNPHNPIIGARAFSSIPTHVAECGVLWLRGHQASGTAACAKHFPGHGDTSVDSHVDLPYIPHDLARLKSVELFPFQAAIDAGVELVMTAHLLVPALDQVPATFSHKIVTKLLKEEMGFQGVVITDALNMKALSNQYTIEEIAQNAFFAGHDLLLYGDHIAPNIDEILRIQLPRAFEALKCVPQQQLNSRVLKILRLKKKYIQPVPPQEGLYEDLHTQEALELQSKLMVW